MNVHLISPRPLSAPANFPRPDIKPDERMSEAAATRMPENAIVSDPELSLQRQIIYKSGNVSPPSDSLTINAREQRVEGYANRVVNQIKKIESGSEGDRNIKFQNLRLFMEPSGYFSAGLLAAGFDPHEKITVKFDTYVGTGFDKKLSNTDTRTYFAWEIAAGVFAHDKVGPGGAINFHSMTIEPTKRRRVKDLEAVGKSLQRHWENEISAPMRDASGALTKRSGKADAYVVRGTLQSLRSDKAQFEMLSPEGQAAINRTLDRQNGQVIIPNIYGYPVGGYAFVPYTPYDGNYEHRPNRGMMIDLKNGALHEINGDDSFAQWAQNNRDHLLRGFNASDRQGGLDAHWPKAQQVLDSLILGHTSHYPGYRNLLSDQQIPVRETFNFTRSRGGDYQLKYGGLNRGLVSTYQTLNANNAVWSDKTEVFGSSQQGWKAAKDVWDNTFGYIPVIGNTGNIVFGVHDSLYGMTANERIGGNSAAVISGLQLAHELAPSGMEAGRATLNAPSASDYNWRYNSQASSFELVRAPKESSITVAPFPGMQEVEFNGQKYFVADKPDAGDGQHYVLRVRDPNDTSKLASSGKIAKPDAEGVWKRRGVAGGNVFEPVRIPESRAINLINQRAATPDQIVELNVSPGGRYIVTTLNQESYIPEGAFAFVVRADEPDKIYLGSLNKKLTETGLYRYNSEMNPDAVDGHSALTHGLQQQHGGTTDVFFAGTVHFKNGRPGFWSNKSGHYAPPAELRHTNLSPAIKKIFPEDKFVSDTKMSQAQKDAWNASTTLTRAEEAERERLRKDQREQESDSELSSDDGD